MAQSTLVEFKSPIPLYRGSGFPTLISPPPLQYCVEPTPGSTVLSTVIQRSLGNLPMAFRLATALTLSSSGTGAVNSIVAISSVASLASFSALSTLFTEFFVSKMHLRWEPVSMFNGPVGFSQVTQVSSLPLGVVSLQHAQSANPYTSLSSMSNSSGFDYHNTGRPFHHVWTNVESSNSKTVVVSTAGSTTPSQSWCQTANVAYYTGAVQFLSLPAPPALAASQVLGSFIVEYDVMFRVRNS